MQIYTWPDATLKELCELLQGAIPNADNENAKLLFSLVFLDQNGNVGIRQVRLHLWSLYCGTVHALVIWVCKFLF